MRSSSPSMETITRSSAWKGNCESPTIAAGSVTYSVEAVPLAKIRLWRVVVIHVLGVPAGPRQRRHLLVTAGGTDPGWKDRFLRPASGWHTEPNYDGVNHVRSDRRRMTPSTARTTVDKATLYCPECDHKSRINGDWTITVHADFTAYECPACETTIDTRRNRDAMIAGSSGAPHFAVED
jgi:hypothetical protein